MGFDATKAPRANCPKCKQTDIPVRDGKLLRHNIPQRVQGPEELAVLGGAFVFAKCDNVDLGRKASN